MKANNVIKSMRRAGLLLSTLLFIVAITSLPTTTSAAELSKLKGSSADYYFNGFDGCVYTDVFVLVNGVQTHNPPAAPTVETRVWVGINQLDFCAGEFGELTMTGWGDASLQNGEFQATSKLSSASLDTTVDFFDTVSSTSFPIDVSLSWTGTGDLQRSQLHLRDRFGLSLFILRSSGTSRSATVTGTVSDDVTTFNSGPSYHESGILRQTKEGTVLKIDL